ncbi:putative ribonuclease H-like domain-containing protein [Tanacetum coccineum]
MILMLIAEVTLIDETQERFDEEMLFDVQDDLQGEEVVAEKEVAKKKVSVVDPVTTAGKVVTTASATTTADELTLAQTLIEIKAAKPKAVTTAATIITTVFLQFTTSKAKDSKGGKNVEPEKPLKKKDQIALDEELALRLQAEEQAELGKERVAQEKASRAAIIEELDSIQAMIDANEQLAARLQAEEQEQFSIKEKSRMLVEMIAKEKSSLQHREKQSKEVSLFVPMDSEVVKSNVTKTEGSSKRARDELESNKSKKQKLLQDIDKEDLETLWKLVKAKHDNTRLEEDYERVLWVQDNIDAGNSDIEAESAQDYFVLPIWSSYTSTVKSSKAKNAGEESNKNHDLKIDEKPVDKEDQVFLDELERLKRQEHGANDAAEALRKEFGKDTEDLLLQAGAAKASSTNTVNTTSTPVSTASPYGRLSFTDTDQDDSKILALEDMYNHPTDGIFTNASYDDVGAVADFTNLETIVNEELLQFKIQKVWILVDLPYGKKAIRTKWVYRNKKDERGVVVRNKARIKVIRIFLAFASYMGFIVYQMDVKSAFLYGKIDEEVYVSQPPGFVDPKYPKKVYNVVKALYVYTKSSRLGQKNIMLVQVYVDDIIFGSTKRSWCDEFEALMKSRFQMSSMGELTFFLGLQVKQKEDGIFISQDKYVAKILKKFDFASVKTASTPIETQKPLVKDEEASDVDVHLYRSMIGSLMYLTASRPDIMFAVCACSRKYTTEGCQFLGRRLISWQCKKQTIMATSTTEAKYVAAANCCGQVLWIKNQIMVVLESCPKYNMVAYLEKIDGNIEFHEIVSFLTRSSIYYALTVSLVVSTTFVEQFWMSAKSKIINNVRYITAKVAGKPVSISEASIRSDLLFDDADGIDSLPN